MAPAVQRRTATEPEPHPTAVGGLHGPTPASVHSRAWPVTALADPGGELGEG